MSRRAVFLDRDGVINVEGGEFVSRPEDLCILPGALEAIAALTRAHWPVVVFTNQSGVGRGRMSMDDLRSVHDSLETLVQRAGGRLSGIYACPHQPDAGCDCRKPKPGMLRQAACEHDIELQASFAVGDSPRDIAAGQAAGCTTVLVLSGHTKEISRDNFPTPHPDHIFPDVLAFTSWLLALPS